jgi:adenosylmethionine-8-amino-7-oxononanoate aminotransferase
VFAKGVTSGYLPLGGVIVGERVSSPFWDDGSNLIFRHGLTYAGHASVCAAAMANLDIIERESLVERVRELESVLAANLRPLEEHTLVREVRTGIGLLTGIVLVDHVTALRVSDRCLAKGVLMRALPDGVLHVSPPFVITEDEVRFLAGVIAESLDEEVVED